MSGLVAFARNCNSPNRQAYELLQLPSFPLGLGLTLFLWSISIDTGLVLSIPSLVSMDSIYISWEMRIPFHVLVILMPTIFVGSPKSVISHSALS
jgi:hypothetical protein